MRAAAWTARQFRSLGPYLAVELILPGGSILALLLWTYRHSPVVRQTAARIATSTRALWAGFTGVLLAASSANTEESRCASR
jgi:hypothetical protein